MATESLNGDFSLLHRFTLCDCTGRGHVHLLSNRSEYHYILLIKSNLLAEADAGESAEEVLGCSAENR